QSGACEACVDGCIDCTAANQCTACKDGKYLKNGASCVDGAGSTCGAGKYADRYSGKCESCVAGTTGSSSQKIAGITDCAACSLDEANGRLTCSSCGSGGKLLKTDTDGITSCVESNTCTADYFTEGSECVLCGNEGKGGVAGCKSCSDKSTCTACLEGYYDSGTPKCTACAENCLTCNDANAGQCTKCSPGFFLSGGSPGTCSVCGANCATCTQAGDDKCLTCKQGYFMKTSNGPGQCFACDDTKNQGVEGCAQCNGGATPTCTKCKPNYRENSAGTFSCTKVCEDDSACGGTAGSCDAIVVDGDGSVKYHCSQCRQQ
ncbi:Variant-specific surface protein, partial [Giardia duodenalis]